jgi:hypothetical protein
MQKPSDSDLISKESSNFDSNYESSDSHTVDGKEDFAKRAIQGAIDAQSDEDSSRDTLKPSRLANYNSSLILPNNHLKLTKLKREIYKQKSSCDELTVENKKKTKRKKELEDEILKLKRQIEGITNSKASFITESSQNFIENKFVKATSTRHDFGKSIKNKYLDNEEDSKQMMDEVLRNTMSSGVETDYWKRVNERNRFTAAGHARLNPLDGFEDHATKKGNFYEQNGEPNMRLKGFSTQQDFFGPNKPMSSNLTRARLASESRSNNQYTSLENVDVFGNMLPSKMGVYRPNEFIVTDEDNNLNSILPNINKRREQQKFDLKYGPRSKYFVAFDETGNQPGYQPGNHTDRSRKSHSHNQKSKRTKDKGSKTARASNTSGLPNFIKSKGKPPVSKRGTSNNTSTLYSRPELDITNFSNLEKAYKNILPREIEMLEDDIEIRNSSRPSSSIRVPHLKMKLRGKHFFQNRFKSLEHSQEGTDYGGKVSRISPMDRRNKNKKKKKQK